VLGSIKDKNGDTPQDLVSRDDEEVLALFRQARAEKSVSKDDVASGMPFH
jgi:hypothetical protein